MKIVMYILAFSLASAALVLGASTLYDRQYQSQDSAAESYPNQANSAKQIEALVKKDLKLPENIIEKTPPHFLAGFDWGLPENTKVEPYSGFVGENYYKLSVSNNQFIIVRWDKANPKKGVYDFSRMDKAFKKNPNLKALVRLEVNSSCEAPEWALKKLRVSKDRSLIFWDKEYLDAITPFINEFAKRYAHLPNISGVQLGIGDGEYRESCDNYDNKEGWGEFWMSPDTLKEAQQNFGFNTRIFVQRSKEIIDIYANAFGSNKFKLAYTNQGPLFTYGEGSEPFNTALKDIIKHAFDNGIGGRDGQVEMWMRYLTRAYGNHLTSMPDNTCRLDFDENFANKLQGRYWGTENEFYGTSSYVLAEHGPYKNQPYRFMVSSLRALQMRRNFISLSDASMVGMDHPDYKSQVFIDYLKKVMGKTKDNTPDAFVLMGERYVNAYRSRFYKDLPCVKNNGNKIPVRSFGRWITENSTGKPAVKISMPESEKFWGQGYYLPQGVDYEYMARESNLFRFDLNDQLSKKRCKVGGCLVEIKATFKDTTNTQLTAYVGEGKSHIFQTVGDNKIKTVSFRLKSHFKNGLSGSDIVLKSDKEAIPLILLRVNFL